jgi:D-threo-aldose 1-dehydrogenase
MNLPASHFGVTGKETTRIGLGGAVITHESEDAGIRVVRAAVDAGVKYFDTSPGYGQRRSQPVFGEGLVGAPDDIVVATKIGYFDDPADYRRPDAIRAQIEESLRLLKRDRVDVLQVHEANWRCWWTDGADREQIREDESYDFAGAPVFEALVRAREDGLCDHIGITGNVADQMTRVLRDVDVDTLLVAFNYDLIRRRATRDAIPLARSRDLAVILGAIFHGSRMVAPHPEWLAEPPEWMSASLRDRFARLYQIQRESGLSLVELAVRFSIAQPDTSVVLVGVKNTDELFESLGAAEAGPLPADLHRAIEELGTQDA